MSPSRPRVLLAEDNLVNQKLIQRMLERLGCEVSIAADGRQAVELAGQSAFHLILMDCSMPEMDGYEATAELRAKESGGTRMPIVALTGHSSEGDREKCLAAGMDDFLTKPVTMDQLKAVLTRWVAEYVSESA